MATKKPVRNSAAKVSKKAASKPVAKAAKKSAPAKNSKPAVKSAAAKKATPKKTAKASVKAAAKASSAKANKKAVKPTAKPVAAPKKLAKPAEKAPKKEQVKAVEEVKPKLSVPQGKHVDKPVAKKTAKPEPVKEIKIPKTTVKTVIPYQPEYKPLEQRIENTKNNEPLVRYSDSDLNEFRELINKKLEAAKKELAYLQGLITRKDDMGGDETDNRYMTMEDGGMSMEREQLSQMASRQITYIDHLEKALIRIENKTYGICRVTGKLIDKARLRAVPHATLSLEAKLGLVKPTNEQ